jgi:hypothetical protein
MTNPTRVIMDNIFNTPQISYRRIEMIPEGDYLK